MNSIADYLREQAFKSLFTTFLGSEHATGGVTVAVDGRTFPCAVLAHKRGLQVLCCAVDNRVLVNRGLLRKVQQFVTQTFPEHVLIFSCGQAQQQVWQWALRLADGRKVRHREFPFFSASPPAPLLVRLAGLRFTRDEEEGISRVEALNRIRRALDTPPARNRFVRSPRLAERGDELFEAMQQGGAEETHRFLLFHLRLVRKMAIPLGRWFGLSPTDAQQIGFLGHLFGLTRERVRQIQRKAEGNLRRLLQGGPSNQPPLTPPKKEARGLLHAEGCGRASP